MLTLQRHGYRSDGGRISRPHCPVEDEEVSKALERNFKKAGINILTSAEVTQVDTKGKGVTATIKTAKGEESLKADIVLSAVGIKTNIENLGLQEVGIAVDRDKILVNDFYQTNLPAIMLLAM